jgi:hypothetical protein
MTAAEAHRSLVGVGELTAVAGVVLDVVDTEHGRHLTLRAAVDLRDIATGWFSQLAVGVPLTLAAADAQLLGFAFTQFALPVTAGPTLDFDFRPAPNLHSPPALGLLLVTSGDRTTLVAPLSAVHEQIVSVHGGELRWGWHGDLDEVSAGFESTVGIYDGETACEVLDAWAAELQALPPRRRDANPITSHLSYWTDNGAAYWYRTEPSRTIGASVVEAVGSLRADGVPVHAVELDSWCYVHETPRPIAEIGYPEEVPPTGMMSWTPRSDVFDTTIDDFRADVDDAPLVIHSRHVSPKSPYLADGDWWVDVLAAQPVDPQFFRRWFDDAVRWGVCCIEQDWMLMYWFGVRALRSAPGRAAAWQDALDRHAADTGVGLMWCMATPADIVHAASLPNVVAVRTSDDYRFAADPALLWTWYLTVNRLASALGLAAFKDVFFSGPSGEDPIDGDEHAELEALLSALSAGPVGIGDRIGRTNREVVMRTCDADGRLRHVDHPVGLIDECLFGRPARGQRLAWATTTATVGSDVWTYVIAINTSTDHVVVYDTLPLDGWRSVLDWRRGALDDLDRLEVTLAPRDWAFWVVAAPGHRADEGDITKYVTVPSARP